MGVGREPVKYVFFLYSKNGIFSCMASSHLKVQAWIGMPSSMRSLKTIKFTPEITSVESTYSVITLSEYK